MNNTKPTVIEATEQKPAMTTGQILAENERLKNENALLLKELQRRETMNTPSQAAEIVNLNEHIKGLNAQLDLEKQKFAELEAKNARLKAQINGSNKINGSPSLPALALRLKMHPIDLNTWIEANSRKGNDKSKKPDVDTIKKQLATALDFCHAREFEPEHNLIDIVSDMFKLTTTTKKPTIPASKMNPMKDAIVAAFKWDEDKVTKAMWGEINAAAKQLCEVDCNPEHICYGVTYLKSKFDSPGPMALAKHYAQWSKTVPKYAPDIDPLWGEPRYDEKTMPGDPVQKAEVEAVLKSLEANLMTIGGQ